MLPEFVWANFFLKKAEQTRSLLVTSRVLCKHYETFVDDGVIWV